MKAGQREPGLAVNHSVTVRADKREVIKTSDAFTCFVESDDVMAFDEARAAFPVGDFEIEAADFASKRASDTPSRLDLAQPQSRIAFAYPVP